MTPPRKKVPAKTAPPVKKSAVKKPQGDRFSDHFKITRTAQDDWFDPHLRVDTKLFVDPLLLIKAGGVWRKAHKDLIAHFIQCYAFIAKSAGKSSVSAKAAHTLLKFPEPKEFGLGYTASGVNGSGGSDALARLMSDGIAVAIAAGLTVPEHIEEIGILNEGIGADRISDAVCNVLKSHFIAYTQDVANRHGIPMTKHEVRNASCDAKNGRWNKEKVDLPTNPYTGGPIILVPEKLLDSLPTLNANDWFDSSANADLRTQMNLQVGQRAKKADIVKFARKHPDRVRDWAKTQTSRTDLKGYDFGADPQGVVQWSGAPIDWARQHALAGIAVPHDQASLGALVDEIMNQFKHFVEDQRGWSLLHNSNGTEKPEEAAQLLFMAMAQHYLRLFDVEVDREVELGRGPVDFKLSSGTKARLLIEIKKAHNGKFWNGLEAQLPSYVKSDAAPEGWFVAIQYRKSSDNRMKDLPKRVTSCATKAGKTIKYAAIDAQKKVSASKQNP